MIILAVKQNAVMNCENNIYITAVRKMWAFHSCCYRTCGWKARVIIIIIHVHNIKCDNIILHQVSCTYLPSLFTYQLFLMWYRIINNYISAFGRPYNWTKYCTQKQLWAQCVCVCMYGAITQKIPFSVTSRSFHSSLLCFACKVYTKNIIWLKFYGWKIRSMTLFTK